jgi:hypothetical protein
MAPMNAFEKAVQADFLWGVATFMLASVGTSAPVEETRMSLASRGFQTA